MGEAGLLGLISVPEFGGGGDGFAIMMDTIASFATPARPSVMAPTSDLLFDFIGKAACGLPLF